MNYQWIDYTDEHIENKIGINNQYICIYIVMKSLSQKKKEISLKFVLFFFGRKR